MASPTPSFRMSSHDPLPALQHTAERVSRQVEDFAKSLDQYCSHKPDASSIDTWKQARHLVKTYQGAVERRIHNVTHSSKHNKLKRKSSLPPEQEDELQACELEADTWDIVYSLLELQDPSSKAQVEEAQKTAFDGLHRYSTDGQVWDAFLNSDGFAQECYTILLWLQRTAARSRPPIEDVIAEKAAQAERGEGIWSAGWLYTKSAIKNTKRMRSWPKPLDPNAPGLQATLRGTDDTDDIVSQLDPDAVTRQRHSLVSSDRYHEKASWQACWEMLRRGSKCTEVEDWWKERKESWRAASILGASLRPELYTADAGISWMISLPRKVRSRAMTALANADVNLDEHEAAVYGLLCSQTQPSLGACSTIDDYLFVYFSNLLLNCYHRFCEMYHDKAYSQKTVHLQPTVPQYELINQVLQNSQSQAKMKEESQVPFKFVQAAIVSKQYNSFFVRIGKALSILAQRAGDSTLIFVEKEITADDSALAAAEDPEALRIIAHLYVLLKTLGQVSLHGTDDQLAQNCISGYIAVLREEAKMEMIPLYIAHISSLRRRAQTLGSVLIDITDPGERQLQASLLKKYQLDVGPVLLVMFKTLYYKKKETSEKGFLPVHLVEYAGAGKLKSFRVKADFLEDELTNDEELLIRCLEWYQYTDPKKEWQHCCTVATALYIHFITKGCLGAARALLSRASLASLSQLMTNTNLALADDIEDSDYEYDGEPDGLPAEERSKSVSPSKSRRRPSSGAMSPPDISQMRQQAQTWRELEELVGIFEALDGWSAIAAETEKYVICMVFYSHHKLTLSAGTAKTRNAWSAPNML